MSYRQYLLEPTARERLRVRSRGYLTHWELEGASYSCTWRLDDSLPAQIIRQLREERRRMIDSIREGRDELTVIERSRVDELFASRVDHYLDRGFGSCLLRDPRAATIVKKALEHFAGARYDLLAWCVMPSHVHVAMTPLMGQGVNRLLHSWKSFTAHEINKLLGREGALWQKEYYDRIIRDSADLERVVEYIVSNPVKAGLRDWPWMWRSDACW